MAVETLIGTENKSMTEKTSKKQEAPKKKIIKVKKERCKGCDLCVHVCPHDALEMSKNFNKKGLPYVILKNPEKCTGCGMCVLMCPDAAIEVVYFE